MNYNINFEAFKNKKILITGGFGFVGVNLFLALKKNNIEPFILDYFHNVKDIDHKFLPFHIDDTNYYNVNLVNRKEISETINEICPDFIVHLASITDLKKDIDTALIATDVNIKGTLHLFDAIKKNPIEGFVFLSTSDIYGGVKPPFKENQRVIPASPYSVTKASVEYFSLLFHEIENLPITILRGFNFFGQFQKSNRVIPFIIMKLIKGEKVNLTLGEQKREFNYIENLIDAILLSLTNKQSFGKIINIGSGNSISIKEVAIKIAERFDLISNLDFGAIPYRENEIWDMYCDNSLAKEILNWTPKIDFEIGLNRTIDWYIENFN